MAGRGPDEDLLGAHVGTSAPSVSLQRRLAKDIRLSCVAIKKKKGKKKKNKKEDVRRALIYKGPHVAARGGRALCTKIRAGLQHQPRQ